MARPGLGVSSPQLRLLLAGLLAGLFLAGISGQRLGSTLTKVLNVSKVAETFFLVLCLTWQTRLERENSACKVWSFGRTRKSVTLKFSLNLPDLSLAACNKIFESNHITLVWKSVTLTFQLKTWNQICSFINLPYQSDSCLIGLTWACQEGCSVSTCSSLVPEIIRKFHIVWVGNNSITAPPNLWFRLGCAIAN